jgi:hypothetical protein
MASQEWEPVYEERDLRPEEIHEYVDGVPAGSCAHREPEGHLCQRPPESPVHRRKDVGK